MLLLFCREALFHTGLKERNALNLQVTQAEEANRRHHRVPVLDVNANRCIHRQQGAIEEVWCTTDDQGRYSKRRLATNRSSKLHQPGSVLYTYPSIYESIQTIISPRRELLGQQCCLWGGLRNLIARYRRSHGYRRSFLWALQGGQEKWLQRRLRRSW